MAKKNYEAFNKLKYNIGMDGWTHPYKLLTRFYSITNIF